MVEKTNKYIVSMLLALVLGSISSATTAADLRFTPSLGITETYSDNVLLSSIDEQSSLVSQYIIGADASITSKRLQFSFSGSETLVRYSHDSELNDHYQALQSNFLYDLWENKLQVIGSSSINNISNSDLENGAGDLISGDTVQQINNSGGLQFQTINSDYSISSSLIYNQVNTEDEIGESKGYTVLLSSQNESAARYVFWQVDGSFINRKNSIYTSENYQFEAKLGAITQYKLNPFLHVYNERITGNTAGSNPDAIPAWGPGLRYQAAKHFIVDLSYNFVNDDTDASDDYLAADIDWQPSSRTSLKASYSKRFFGDSYELDFNHKTKRLTNMVSYHETVEVFDRNSFIASEEDLWCPSAAISFEECLPLGQIPEDTNGFQSFPVSIGELEENNEFSLNKRLSWQSTLALSRTTFTINASNREREALSTGVIDTYADARVTFSRRISARSNLSVYLNYSKNVFDKNRPEGPRQKDIYKTFSATYNKNLASSLTAFFTLQYVDRQSSLERYIYDEARAAINLTKDF